MIQTLLLILVQIFGIYFTYTNLEKQQVKSKLSKKEMLMAIYVACFIGPLLEESLFRSVCKQYLSGIPYSDIINGLIFGLAHIQNFIVHNNKYIILFQVLAGSYLGYYVVQFESFIYAFLVHALHNFVIAFGSYVLYYYKHKDDKNDVNECDLISVTPCEFNIIKYPIKNIDDSTRLKFGDYKYIKRNKINKELLVSIDKFEAIKNKRFNIKNFTQI